LNNYSANHLAEKLITYLIDLFQVLSRYVLLKEIEQTPALILYATADDTTTTTNDVLCDFAILLSSES